MIFVYEKKIWIFLRFIGIPSLKEVIVRNSDVVNTNCTRMEILDNIKII